MILLFSTPCTDKKMMCFIFNCIALSISGTKYFFTAEICGGLTKKSTSIFLKVTANVDGSVTSNFTITILYAFSLSLNYDTINPKRESLTADILRTFPGYENYSNELVSEVIDTLGKLSMILYE